VTSPSLFKNQGPAVDAHVQNELVVPASARHDTKKERTAEKAIVISIVYEKLTKLMDTTCARSVVKYLTRK
jgi:hypothetical protein